jgi:hypothetical protein
MSLDATKPTDVELMSALPIYIREARAAINALSGGGDVGVTDLTIAAGAIALTVGTDLGLFGLETVIVDALAGVNISTIVGGSQGQVKIFIFQDNNIGIVDGLALNGGIYLNQLPALTTFAAQTNDVLALVNVGGNGSTIQGYWKEIFRQIALK